jgi:hypothetical protein
VKSSVSGHAEIWASHQDAILGQMWPGDVGLESRNLQGRARVTHEVLGKLRGGYARSEMHFYKLGDVRLGPQLRVREY